MIDNPEIEYKIIRFEVYNNVLILNKNVCCECYYILCVSNYRFWLPKIIINLLFLFMVNCCVYSFAIVLIIMRYAHDVVGDHEDIL